MSPYQLIQQLQLRESTSFFTYFLSLTLNSFYLSLFSRMVWQTSFISPFSPFLLYLFHSRILFLSMSLSTKFSLTSTAQQHCKCCTIPEVYLSLSLSLFPPFLPISYLHQPHNNYANVVVQLLQSLSLSLTISLSLLSTAQQLCKC